MSNLPKNKKHIKLIRELLRTDSRQITSEVVTNVVHYGLSFQESMIHWMFEYAYRFGKDTDKILVLSHECFGQVTDYLLKAYSGAMRGDTFLVGKYPVFEFTLSGRKLYCILDYRFSFQESSEDNPPLQGYVFDVSTGKDEKGISIIKN